VRGFGLSLSVFPRVRSDAGQSSNARLLSARLGLAAQPTPIDSLRKWFELARNAITEQIGDKIGGWPGDAAD
jgi:hypothetical protein